MSGDESRETTLSILYRQEPDALARVLSVLRRLRIHLEVLSAFPAGEGTARALLLIRAPAYHADRARALIARLVPVLQVTAAADDGGDSLAPSHASETSAKGFDNGHDPL